MHRLYDRRIIDQISKLESVQRRFTKRIAGLRDMPYVETEKIATGKSRNQKTSQ